MKSKSSIFLTLMIFSILAVLGVNIGMTQANTLSPQGATIDVTTFEDILANDGLCSLREAIQSANSNISVGGCTAGEGTGTDTINLISGTYTVSIIGPDEDSANSGDLDITENLEITGNGTSFTKILADFGAQPENWDRIFHVSPDESDITVTMEDLTIENGDISYQELGVGDEYGGGGVLTNAELILQDVLIKGNKALRGGGIRVTNTGKLEIMDSTIQGNIVEGDEGGGIYGNASITLSNVQLLNNEADRGGGMFCDGNCSLTDVTISENTASYGGGFYNDSTAEVQSTTIYDNYSSDEGGGIFNGADLTLTNVTISGNYSIGEGSALVSEGIASLVNITIYQNESSGSISAGLVNGPFGSLNLVNTIIDNSPRDCLGDFQSYGANISSDTTCDLAHDTDLHNTPPALGVLSDNGGPTKTHSPITDSPAIDAGNNSRCAYDDQRGYPRPADGNRNGIVQCDIGAVELSPGGILGLNPVDYQIVESDVSGSVQLTVLRQDAAEGSVSVDYLTWEAFSPDWAVEDIDFVGKRGTLSWADGDNSPKYITIDIIDDSYDEPNEIFYVFLSNSTGGATIIPAARQAKVTIIDDVTDSDPEPPDPVRNFIFLPLVSREK
jgi:CSLREA domain-containing protein